MVVTAVALKQALGTAAAEVFARKTELLALLQVPQTWTSGRRRTRDRSSTSPQGPLLSDHPSVTHTKALIQS